MSQQSITPTPSLSIFCRTWSRHWCSSCQDGCGESTNDRTEKPDRSSAFVAARARIETAIAAQNPGAQAQSPATDKDVKVNEKKVSEGEAYAKQLLMLMDRDRNGKVSKAEFMAFMEAEFRRLDVNKDGELDVKELTQTRLFHGGGHR
jgi:hypothetical protein